MLWRPIARPSQRRPAFRNSRSGSSPFWDTTLRNPLASIDYGAALLQRRAADSATRRTIDRMRTSFLRMSRMIEQILDLTRARLGGGLELKAHANGHRAGAHADHRRATKRDTSHPRPSTSVVPRWRGGVGRRSARAGLLEHHQQCTIVWPCASPSKAHQGEKVAGKAPEVSLIVHNHGKPIPEDVQATLFDPFRRGRARWWVP